MTRWIDWDEGRADKIFFHFFRLLSQFTMTSPSPNADGKSPGGDIFIHGEDRKNNYAERDWTAGCISVKNKDIEEIFALVKVGTPIMIRP